MEAYTLPFKELNTQALAKKPTPTAANPQPATSSYRKAPNPMSNNPITIIIKVAHPKIVFLFNLIIVELVLRGANIDKKTIARVLINKQFIAEHYYAKP